jgi:hypothetical protein
MLPGRFSTIRMPALSRAATLVPLVLSAQPVSARRFEIASD